MPQKPRCYYEILGVSRDCGDEELRKAYRRLALQYHPDKNLDNPEYCHEQFLQVQHAYDVLGDRHERAWYDKHREQILRGGFGKASEQQQENQLDVFQFMSAGCYDGFEDLDEDQSVEKKNGFYSVYSRVFEQISAEDLEFMDTEWEIPEFGSANSDYLNVVGPFYAYWEAYSTSKSFVWVEKFDPREAADRPTKRAMEAENKKLRETAKRERNREVRMLVRFVKKRDRRVQVYREQLQQQTAEIERKQIQMRNRHRAANFAALHAQDGSSVVNKEELDEIEHLLANIESNMGSIFNDVSSSESSSSSSLSDFSDQDNDQLDEDEGKTVRFSKESINHDRARREEEKQRQQQQRKTNDNVGESVTDFYCIACSKNFKNERSFANHENSAKHRANLAKLISEMSEDDRRLMDGIGGNRLNNDGGGGDNVDVDVDVDIDVDVDENSDVDLADAQLVTDLPEFSGERRGKKSKRQKKRDRQNRIQQEEETVDERTVEEETVSVVETSQTVHDVEDAGTSAAAVCSTCSVEFASRNKLFGHLKETGHAALKSDGKKSKKKAGKTKKN